MENVQDEYHAQLCVDARRSHNHFLICRPQHFPLLSHLRRPLLDSGTENTSTCGVGSPTAQPAPLQSLVSGSFLATSSDAASREDFVVAASSASS